MLQRNIKNTLLLSIFFLFFAIVTCSPKNNSDQEPITKDIPTKLDLNISPQSPIKYTAEGMITITATLTPQVIGTPPVGLVVFAIDSKSICEGIHLSNNNNLLQAVCEIHIKELIAGRHDISAQYMGESGYAKSNQQTLTYIITQYPTNIDTFEIINSPKDEFGAFMTLTATMKSAPNNPDFEGIIKFKNETTNQPLCDAKAEKNGNLYTFECGNIQLLPTNFKDTNRISAIYLDEKYYANSTQLEKNVNISKITPIFKGSDGSEKAALLCEGGLYPLNECFAGYKITVSGRIQFGALDIDEKVTSPTIQAAWKSEASSSCQWTKSSSLNPDYIHNFTCTYQTNSEKDAGTSQCFIIAYSGDIAHTKKSSDYDNKQYACVTLLKPGNVQLTIKIIDGNKEYTLGDQITISGTIEGLPTTPLDKDKLKFYLYSKNLTDFTAQKCTITEKNFNCTYSTMDGDVQKFNNKFSIVYEGDTKYARHEEELQNLKIKQIVPTIINTSINKNIVKINDEITINGTVGNLNAQFPLSLSGTSDDHIDLYLNNQKLNEATCTLGSDGIFKCTYQITKDLPQTGTIQLAFSAQFIGSKNYQTSSLTPAGTAIGCPTATALIKTTNYITVDPQGFVTFNNIIDPQMNGFNLDIVNICPSISCADISITARQDYALIKASDTEKTPFKASDSHPQYTCKEAENPSDHTKIITLSAANQLEGGFRPWVDKFNIIVGDNTTFAVSVNTPVDPGTQQLLTRAKPMFLNPNFSGCGLKGTVLQRVYDCSKKIKNYAVYIDPKLDTHDTTPKEDGTSTFYTLFDPINNPTVDPNDYWFLAACPSGAGGSVSQEYCAWLTPQIKPDNPAFDQNPDGIPTFQLSMLKGYQPRLLFGGQLPSGFKWEEANGAPFDPSIQYYANDTSNPGVTPAKGSKQPPDAPPVCVAKIDDALYGGKKFTTAYANVRDIISSPSGAIVNWQMPSYPMLILLSGGTPTTRQFVTNFASYTFTHPISKKCYDSTDVRPNCNISKDTNAMEGFSAINVPGFIDSSLSDIKDLPPKDFFLLSSSSGELSYSSSDYIWVYSIFDIGEAYGPGYGVVYGASMLPIRMATSYLTGSLPQIRCVSLSWY